MAKRGRPGAVKWTEEQEEMIRELYPKLGSAKTAEILNVDPLALGNRARYMGLRMEGRVAWTEEKIQEAIRRYASEGPANLSDTLGIPYHALVAKVRRNSSEVTRKRPPEEFEWTDERLDVLKARYVSDGGIVLADEMNLYVDTVRKKASELGLHTRIGHQHKAERNDSCNIHYFDQWTPGMAYILGFIFADGCIRKNLTTVAVGIAESDRCVLEFMKSELKSSSNIYRRDGIVSPRTGKLHQPQVHFLINSTVVVKKLMELGIKPRKTYLNEAFPEIPDEMMGHFTRGNLDGDGSIHLNKKGGCALSLTGPENFITGIHNRIRDLIHVSKKKIQTKKGKTANISAVYWSAEEDLFKLKEFIYPGDEFCLERKKIKLTSWLDKKLLRTRPWTMADYKVLKSVVYDRTTTEIAGLLSRDPMDVKAEIKALNLL